jgi:hypothetical protein
MRDRLRDDVKHREGTDVEPSPQTNSSTTRFGLSFNDSHVVVRLSLGELIRVVLPQTNWWQGYAFREPPPDLAPAERMTPPRLQDAAIRKLIAKLIPRRLEMPENGEDCDGVWITPDLVWMVHVGGVIAKGPRSSSRKPSTIVDAFCQLIADGAPPPELPRPLVWSVSRNRPLEQSLRRSTMTTKADAARTLFRPDCSHLNWGVIDSGIDATHVAFRERRTQDDTKHPVAFEPTAAGRIKNNTRIRETYDFTRMRALLEVPVLNEEVNAAGTTADVLASGLLSGRFVDWNKLEPLLRVEYDPANLQALLPKQEHGTHVAGTIAGEWRKTDHPPAPEEVLEGMCPNLELYDFRVFDDDGKGDEYGVLAALQFVRFLNSGKDQPVIHGVNLSLSIRHDAANFACGSTPVCAECERLVGSGVVVVAAAGNLGYARFQTERGERSDGTRTASITDPGNAQLVITVGSTHRTQPHRYGVSYFSSRGPTSDGRCKPDLVAPGEKIIAPTPGNSSRSMDGTSMAAPHVSGAAAILMARYPELIGRPDFVKEILMKSATDLGRERYFQGAGLVDILRALQSV